MGNWLRLVILTVLLANLATAQQIVINSQEWQDIYSGMLYARLTGQKAEYIIDESHGLLLQDMIADDETLVFESVSRPFIRSYHTNLRSRGINADVRYIEQTLNLELLDEVDADGYIVVDDRYTYNAVSIAPYAVRKKFYVVFANRENIDDIVEKLEGKPVILYGYLDREVTAAFENPTIINKGDKFSNNLELLRLYEEEFGIPQLILTNGAFIEPQFFSGSSPVLFIGQNNVPEQTIKFLKESEVKHALLIGYDIFDNAVSLKNEVDLRIIVKFAKGVDSKQYALDILTLPAPVYKIEINSVEYNTLSKELEITYFNSENFPAFVKGSHNVLSRNQSVQVVGDDIALFVPGEDALTVTYSVDLSGLDFLSIRSNLLYGEDRGALEFLAIVENAISQISYEDQSEIEIEKAYYNKPTGRLVVRIRNTGDVLVFGKPSVIDIVLNDKPETLTTDALAIEPGKTIDFKIKTSMSPQDILDNDKILIGARYGKRDTALIHYKEKEFELDVRIFSKSVQIGSGILMLVIIIILIFLLFKKRKKRHTSRLKPAPPK